MLYCLQGNDFKDPSIAITEVRVLILETFPKNEAMFSRFVVPHIPWLSALLAGESTSKDGIRKVCELLKVTSDVCFGCLVESSAACSSMEDCILCLLSRRTDAGKEEAFYKSTVELLVTLIGHKSLDQITNTHVDGLVLSFMQMIRSEDSDVSDRESNNIYVIIYYFCYCYCYVNDIILSIDSLFSFAHVCVCHSLRILLNHADKLSSC
jgi:hypothetical protein